MADPQQDGSELVEVGFYPNRKQADEHALVASAMGYPWKLEREEGGGFRLLVYERDREGMARELGKFDLENARRRRWREPASYGKIPTVSLFICGWLMCGFFLAQKFGPDWWESAGMVSSDAIVHKGEWWRVLTGLTLHEDITHLGANLAVGLLFAAFVLPLLGTGWTWVMIVGSGAAGNLLTAWNYHAVGHLSIGASTAVFGALGILTARRTIDVVRSAWTFRIWELIVPLGAGLALLAYLGTGGERTDFLAHGWGFASGVCMGGFATLVDLKQRTPVFIQRLLAAIAPSLLAMAWLLAWANGRR